MLGGCRRPIGPRWRASSRPTCGRCRPSPTRSAGISPDDMTWPPTTSARSCMSWSPRTSGVPLTAGELRERMGVSGAAITYLVERMIASGHFRRESDPVRPPQGHPAGRRRRNDRRPRLFHAAGRTQPARDGRRCPSDDLAAAHRTFTAIIDAMRAFRARARRVVTSSISSLAATVAPSVRMLSPRGARPGSSLALPGRSRVRPTATPTVGIGPSCAAPMPRSATRPAQYG